MRRLDRERKLVDHESRILHFGHVLKPFETYRQNQTCQLPDSRLYINIDWAASSNHSNFTGQRRRWLQLSISKNAHTRARTLFSWRHCLSGFLTWLFVFTSQFRSLCLFFPCWVLSGAGVLCSNFGEKGLFFFGRWYEDPIFVNFFDEKKIHEGMTRFWALLGDPCGGTMWEKMWQTNI